MTGDTRDQNRSTAQTTKALAEEQIYQPKRDSFDADMDRNFTVNLKIHFWRFRTNAPVQRMPNELIDNVTKALRNGAITPNEARVFIADALSSDLDFRKEDWASVPPTLAVAAARSGAMTSAEVTDFPSDEGTTIDAAKASRVIARGMTSIVNGHSHRFVALKLGNEKIIFSISDEDNHSHYVPPIKDLQSNSGKMLVIQTGETENHQHELKITVPLSGSRLTARKIAAGIRMIREVVQDEIEEAKDEFFSPTSKDIDGSEGWAI